MNKQKLDRIIGIFVIAAAFMAGAAAFSGNIISFLKNSSETIDWLQEENYVSPFILTSRSKDDFITTGTVSGKAEVKWPFLRVSVNDITVLSHHRTFVDSIRIGIAHHLDGKDWEPFRWSDHQVVAKTLEGREASVVPPFSTLIPIDGIDQQKKYWLILEVRLKGEDKDDYSYTFSHSRSYLFEDM